MLNAKVSIVLMLFLLSKSLLACEIERASACIKFSSIEQCLSKSSCSKDEFYQSFCPDFHYSDCLDDSSQEKCQKIQNDCQTYLTDHSTFDDSAIDRSNFEAYLGLFDKKNNRILQNLTGIEFSDLSPFYKGIGKSPINCGGVSNPADLGSTPSPDKKLNRLNAFFNTAESFGRGVRSYLLGSYQSTITDCSGFLMQSMKRAGMRVLGPQFDLAPNYPLLFKRCDPKNLKPGDMLLLKYPHRPQPDHWIMVTSEGKWPSGDMDIMDVSSDKIDNKPFYKGKLSRRRNLQNRNIYSCMRHRDLDK